MAVLFEQCLALDIEAVRLDTEPEVVVAPVGQAVPGVRNHVFGRHVK